MLKIVVLPAPLGPMSPTNSCGSSVRLKSETAVRPPNRIVTFLASSSGIGPLPFIAFVSRNGIFPPRQYLPQFAPA